MTTHQDTSTEREEPGPVKATPYNPTSEMLWAMKRIDPALTLEQCRSLWAVAWQAALTQPQAQQPQERDPSGIYQMYGAFVACVAGARIPGTYQSWLGARLALALPDDVLIDLLNKAAPNDISDKAVFSAYQEHQKTQAQQAAAVPTGFKLVPVEPTEEMIVDGMQADVLGLPSIDDDSHVLSIFKAMLAAAPPSPVLPLSDEQIESLLVNWPKDGIAFIDFARAIEAAHGITEPGAGGEST